MKKSKYILLLSCAVLWTIGPVTITEAKREVGTSKVNAATARKNARQLQKDVAWGYRQLKDHYKKSDYKAFILQERETMLKLNDTALSVKYRNKMINRINALSKRMKDHFNQSRQTNLAPQPKAEKEQPPKKIKRPSGLSSEEELITEENMNQLKAKRAQETEEIRKNILKANPRYAKDDSRLAQAVVERKLKIVREQNFLESEFDKGLQRLYQRAVELFQLKKYEASQTAFREVESLSPDFQKTRDYLRKLEKMIHR